jgi:hypothetical protein
MTTKPLHVSARFLVSGVLLLPLWYIQGGLALFSNMDREVRLTLLGGAVSVVALVFVLPVLIRGDRPQRIMAALVGLFPIIVLIEVLITVRHYVFGP